MTTRRTSWFLPTLAGSLLLLSPTLGRADEAQAPAAATEASATSPPAATSDPGAAAGTSAGTGRTGSSDNGARKASAHTQFGASGSPPPAAVTGSGFDFGSYGRAGIGSNLRGQSGHPVNVVSFGSRLEKPAYLELNFYYGGNIGDDTSRRWRVIFVPAYSGDLFHYTGNFTQNFAIRNAYAEVENLGVRGLSLWAGSRMYRGDDVYLFDFWPLDNLNTIGGGTAYRFNHDQTTLALHIGMNRLDDLYQVQQIRIPSRRLPPDSTVLSPQQATTTVTTMDRQRLVVSAKATHFLRPLSNLPNGKLIVYGEFHYLPKGERRAASDPMMGLPPEQLPDDYGYVVGAQLGGWLRSFVFANLFIRHAGGLGAFGDLGKPFGFDTDKRVFGAREVTVAWSANYESTYLGVMSGAYFRFWTDASPGDDSGYKEGAVAVRPIAYPSRYFHVAAELSYQIRRPATLDQDRAGYLLPQVFRASLMPIVAPQGRGSYSRPFLYGIYTVSVLNGDAQYYLFEPEDVRAGQNLVHYLGLGVEWWFNSSYR